MGKKELEEIAAELASGYPGNDKTRIAQEFQNVVEMVLPLLAQRVSLAGNRGLKNTTEMWEFVRKDGEKLFEEALLKVERVKVIFVASKFLNNKLIGGMITKQALEMAGHGEDS